MIGILSATKRNEVAESSLFRALPMCAVFYGIVIAPLLRLLFPDDDPLSTSRPEHRIFWTSLALLTILLSIRPLRQNGRIQAPPAIYWLAGYICIAGISIIWSSAPTSSLVRLVQQFFVITSVALPCVVSRYRDQILPSLLTCFAVAVLLNLIFLAIRAPSSIGHMGIYDHKNGLGEVSALAFIFGVHLLFGGGNLRKVVASCTAAGAFVCLVASQSKTSLALACIIPITTLVALRLSYLTRISACLIILYWITLACLSMILLAGVFTWTLDDILTFLFGDPTFTGRTLVWSFTTEMIEKRPLLGWGYQAFWLSGPEAASVREGPGWVALMPHAHNGYLDILLETGWLGLSIGAGLLVAVAFGIETAARNAPATAWLPLSLFMFFALHNFLETSFFRAFNNPWLIFLAVAASTPVATRPASFEIPHASHYRMPA